MCQSHTGRLTGLWFLPKPAFGLNTNDDDIFRIKRLKSLFHPVPSTDAFSWNTYYPLTKLLYFIVHTVGDLKSPASNPALSSLPLLYSCSQHMPEINYIYIFQSLWAAYNLLYFMTYHTATNCTINTDAATAPDTKNTDGWRYTLFVTSNFSSVFVVYLRQSFLY